jgi:predicted  nucleic acid-binding Zn-ribbon protein
MDQHASSSFSTVKDGDDDDSMHHHHQQQQQQQFIELAGLSAGQMVDLCRLQREHHQQQQQPQEKPNNHHDEEDVNNDNNNDDSDLHYYAPIAPYTLMETAVDQCSTIATMEPGRLETRLRSLYDQLQRIG